MKTAKRKAPERKPVRKDAGLALRAGQATLRLASARPAVTGGVIVFAVVFGMISANALWYQPGGHPSPFLRTRETGDQTILPGFNASSEPKHVTTFRIEREDTLATSTAVPDAVRLGVPTPPAASELVRGIQQELVRLKLYDGAADGLSGPKTSAAIMTYQGSTGQAQTGEASESLLVALLSTQSLSPPRPPENRPASQLTAIPASRPTPVPPRSEVVDPVAEAIRKADKISPPAAIPVTPVSARSSSGTVADAGLTSQIQRGLSRFAYSHITVDGVAGTATRDAIRNFERAYRLPETGEPNERVLKKLKDIGAL